MVNTKLCYLGLPRTIVKNGYHDPVNSRSLKETVITFLNEKRQVSPVSSTCILFFFNNLHGYFPFRFKEHFLYPFIYHFPNSHKVPFSFKNGVKD